MLFWKKLKKQAVEETAPSWEHSYYVPVCSQEPYDTNSVRKILAAIDFKNTCINCGVRFDCGTHNSSKRIAFSIPEILMFDNKEYKPREIFNIVKKSYEEFVYANIPEKDRQMILYDVYVRRGQTILSSSTDRILNQIERELHYDKIEQFDYKTLMTL